MSLKRLTKPRFLFVYPVVIALFLTAHVSEKSLASGIVLVILGEALRLWANGHVGHVKVNSTIKRPGEKKIGRLMTAGPYAFVRHPLYLGTLVAGSGFCLMVRSGWLTLAALAAFAATYRKKMAQEERLLHDECGASYEQYAQLVPQLLPSGYRYPHREGAWTWRGIAASKEWKSALWVLAAMILIYFWEESVQEQEWLFSERQGYRFFLLGVLILLVLLDGISELVLRRKRLA